MKLSVIVPCLARDAGVEKCLEVIRSQSSAGGAELDLVVVEGVSPCGKARNEGLRRAIGDYIAWVDADDEVRDGWWKSISGALESSPDAVVFGYHDDRLALDVLYEPPKTDAPQRLLRSVISDDSPYAFLWNKVIRRELYADEHFDEDLHLMTDFVLMPRVISKVKSVSVIEKVLYTYHFGSTSTSRRDWPGREEEVLSIQWQRFVDWRATEYAKDALVPFVQQVVCCHEQILRQGGTSADADLLRRQRRRLVGALFLILRTPMAWRIKIKVLCLILGWAWPQRLGWKFHGVLS